ncbi:hypothetical protein Poli38472_004483 [Pythium oligandrum]|uniref:Crinkler effector protein N-terminal domain-containing protein n=1 Tax=Pythium oligandrum TaxID=41045 RepID=A0A8K1FFX8_PYTOL|nr:hypothetical protein Poli38472_004483 [Pythium oligandrum]|eukprot:TMW59414.1 hypothetical protein Poli38472_004483 [Pythium oligandrum]
MQREGSFFLAWALAVEGHNQVSMVTLFCVLLADGSVFPVKVALHEYISKLKDRIKETNPITVQCEADQLKLFLATTKREKKKKKPRRWLKSTDNDVEALERGDIRDRIKQLFEPQEGDIHVLVEVPGPKRRRLGDKVQDASAQWLDDFHALFVKADALPPLASLAAFIESPLPVKIGLDTCTFERTASQVHTSTLEKICVNDTNAHCQKISEHNLLRRLDPPTAGVTKTEFIVYWDTFIRELIATVLAGKGCANRSTSDSTSTSTSGPDMVFVLNDIIVFRAAKREVQDIPRSSGMVVRLNASSVVKDFTKIHSHDGITLNPGQI